MTPLYFFKKSDLGFTLTEILIVLTIFLLIAMVIYSSHTLSHQTYRQGERAAEITQNGRVILERMTREIRQAREIVTPFPETEDGATNTIKFQDGHVPLVYVTAPPQAVGNNTITLALDTSTTTDFYKDIFIEIIDGAGSGQIRKIIGYDGENRIATLEKAWDSQPTITSVYQIDSLYYIHYFKEETNLWRQIIAYYFPADPKYQRWDAGSNLETKVLEEPRIVGEYLSNLKLWGLDVINFFLTLKKQGKEINLKTKVFGRNL